MSRVTLNLLLAIFMMMLLAACSSDPIQKGDNAFQKGEYAKAVKFYREAYQSHPKDYQVREKLALSYFKLGEYYYRKRKVLSAFAAQVNQGIQLLPDSLTPETKKLLSGVHVSLAEAYMNTPPENIIRKRQFYDNARMHLQTALRYQPDNPRALQAWEQFKNKNFSEMYEKGMKYYQQAKKDKTNYLIAEYYLTRAFQLNPDHTDLRKALMTSRKKTLNMLDPDQQVPIAITDKIRKGKVLSYLIVAHNNSNENYQIGAGSFFLIDENGNAQEGFANDQFANAFTPGSLKPEREKEGVVSFKINPGKHYVRVELRIENKVLGYKNLPF